MKKIKHTIFIHGSVEELNMIQITENQFKILNKDEDDDIRYELKQKLEEELMSESLINGFSYSEDGPGFHIYLDDNEEPIETGGILIDASPEGIEYSVGIKTKPKKKTYWMIGDSYSSKAGFYLKINGEFNFKVLSVGDYDENLSGRITIADRPSAGRFKMVLKNLFSNPGYGYPSSRTDCTSQWEALERTILAECGFSSEYGFELEQVANFINTISPNTLYKAI